MRQENWTGYKNAVNKFPDLSRADFLFTRAKIQLLISYETLALTTLRATFEATDTIPLIGTDGTTVYYNQEEIEKLNETEIARLLLHVCLHPHLFHSDRRGTRDLEKWLRACDIECALEIDKHRKDMGYYSGRSHFVQRENRNMQALMEKFVGKTAEEIYDELTDEQVPNSDTHMWDPAKFPKDRITDHTKYSQRVSEILSGADTGAPMDIDEQYALAVALGDAVIVSAKHLSNECYQNFIKWTQFSGIRKEIAVFIMKNVVRAEDTRFPILRTQDWITWSKEYKFYIL
jgi:hypothetical protein